MDGLIEISLDDICKCEEEDYLYDIKNIITENEDINSDKTISHYHMYDQCQRKCDVCNKIYSLLKNMELYINEEEDDEKGGKKKIKKKEKDFDFIQKPSYFNIQNIDTSKIERLGKKAIYDIINQNILLSASSLSKDVIESIIRNYDGINNYEYDALVKYIEDNTPYALKQQILKLHPYFSLSNLNRSLLEKQIEMLDIIYKSESYQTCNLNSKMTSVHYRNLQSLEEGFFDDVVTFGNNNDFIDPVIFCLFANKLTFFDDLINLVDPLSVLTDMIVNKKICEENKFIMFLKASDPSDFITGETRITDSETRLKHEMYRLLYHNMIKMIALNIRQGRWFSHLTGELSKISSKINYKCFKTEEEKILSTVLSCIPFKPILLTKSTDVLSTVPESVEFVEFDIKRNRMSNMKEALKLDSSILNNITYDSVTRRLCIIRKTMVREEKNCAYLSDLGNVGPFLGNHLPFDMFRSNAGNSTVLLSNGVFFVSIPRVQRKSMSRFFNSGVRNIVIDDPIDIPDDLTIGSEIFSLVGAVLCKTLENSGVYDLCSSKEYIGRYSYNKVDDGWIKYDPYSIQVPYLRNKIVERSLNNMGIDSVEELKRQINEGTEPSLKIKMKIKHLFMNKYSISDFKYSNETAKEEISRYGTLLIYNSTSFENIMCNAF